MDEIKEYTEKLFEDIKHIDKKDNKYWFSRELMPLLEYSKWESFSNTINNEYTANSVHYEVGREVRNSIKRLGGTMPEDLPTPEKSLKELEKESKN